MSTRVWLSVFGYAVNFTDENLYVEGFVLR